MLEEEFKKCPVCKGNKQVEYKGKMEDCYNCKGKGKVPDWSKDEQPEEIICKLCKKPFIIPNRKCTDAWKTMLCDKCFNKGGR